MFMEFMERRRRQVQRWIANFFVTFNAVYQRKFRTNMIFICSRIRLLSEGCLLCCGVAAVYYTEKMKRNLQDWVCNKPLSSSVDFVHHIYCIPVLVSRWVPTWSWRIFFHQRNREGNHTSCFLYIIFLEPSFMKSIDWLLVCTFDFGISVVYYSLFTPKSRLNCVYM